MAKLKKDIDYKKKIKDLEEELVRKQDLIETLQKENKILLKTAIKNSERKVDTLLKKKVDRK